MRLVRPIRHHKTGTDLASSIEREAYSNLRPEVDVEKKQERDVHRGNASQDHRAPKRDAADRE